MGAWRDFLANPSPMATPNPSIIQYLKSRPIRTLSLLLTVFVLLSLFLVPSESLPSFPSTSTFKSASSWIPSIGYLAGGKEIERYDVQHDGAMRDISLSELQEPVFEKDERTGLLYPPDINPFRLNGYRRANAAFVSLVRNQELGSIKESMRSVEERFNRKAGYPWVFMNEVPFTEEFKEGVQKMTRSKCYFARIPEEHWSYPEWIDQDKARVERKKMEDENVIYGGSESYRHMCRFNSGFFYRQEVLQQFDYYWRVEPGVEFYCDLDYDPFLFMEANNKTYGFTITIYEYERTIQTLWPTVRDFVKLHPEYVAEKNSMNFIVDDMRKGFEDRYNLCHFWSNFEIGDLRFWRSKAYGDFFDHLDKAGGFFYERWGDAPVHSIAASLFLPSSALHQFDDIAYRHNPFLHCPVNTRKYHDNGKCNCNPKDSFDTDGYSCMRQWWRVGKRPDK